MLDFKTQLWSSADPSSPNFVRGVNAGFANLYNCNVRKIKAKPCKLTMRLE